MNSGLDAIIIGGGLAGLARAKQLCSQGLTCRLLEASDRVGGRVRTDEVDGFLLDRGFQVFLTAYPEAQAVLDYEKLDLHYFEPGALIRYQGTFHRLSDPWRRPQHFLATALSSAATLSDKLRTARFRKYTTNGDLTDIYHRPERPTIALLRERGFSDVIIERFFRPFLGGVFLERELLTSSRMCEFVFRMFSLGDAALPKNGMGEISQQLASCLPDGVIRIDSPVDVLAGGDVILASGGRLRARALIIATEAPAARRLLGDSYAADGCSVSCFYFAADEPPLQEPILVLDGEGEGPINNLCVPSQISSSFAPPGKSLISATVLKHSGDQVALMQELRLQLRSWFGPATEAWRHLKTYQIEYALPSQSSPALEPVEKPATVRDGVYVCGDHCDTASINGALASGKRAADAALAFCRRS